MNLSICTLYKSIQYPFDILMSSLGSRSLVGMTSIFWVVSLFVLIYLGSGNSEYISGKRVENKVARENREQTQWILKLRGSYTSPSTYNRRNQCQVSHSSGNLVIQYVCETDVGNDGTDTQFNSFIYSLFSLKFTQIHSKTSTKFK